MLSNKSGPIVETTAGPERGKVSRNGTIALHAGIPDAAPPVDGLRWKPPQPVEKWTETRACTKPGAMAQHADGEELLDVFGSMLAFVPQADDEHLLNRAMGDHWYASAATGSPDFPCCERWPQYEPGEPRHMVFDRPTSLVEPCPTLPGPHLIRARVERRAEQTMGVPST